MTYTKTNFLAFINQNGYKIVNDEISLQTSIQKYSQLDSHIEEIEKKKL